MKNVPLEPKDVFLIKENLQKHQYILILIGVSGFLIIVIAAWLNIHLSLMFIVFIVWLGLLFFFAYQIFLWFQSLQSGQKLIYQGNIQSRTMNGKIQIGNQWFSLDKNNFSLVAKAQKAKLHLTKNSQKIIWVEIESE